MAGVFAQRGVAAWVFRGDDGLDELTTTTTSQLWAVEGGRVRQLEVDPRRYGFPSATAADLRGGDVQVNAQVVRDLVDGARGPVRDAVVLNAGAALAVYAGAADDPLEALAAGIAQAQESLDGGAARSALDRWVDASRSAGAPR
jgi:anthranilate phosphoribosyltransferase